MKYLLILLIALSLQAQIVISPANFTSGGGGGGGGPTEIASDDFNRANGTLGANWTDINTNWGSFSVLSNQAEGGGLADDCAMAVWAGSGTFSADQYAQVTCYGLGYNGANYRIAACVRINDTEANRDCYLIELVDDGSSTRTIRIREYTNGSVANLSTTTATIGNGDVIKIQVSGSDITGYLNGDIISALTTSDSTLSDGTPGMMLANGMLLDDWSAGNL